MLRRLAAQKSLAFAGLSSLATAFASVQVHSRAPRAAVAVVEPIRQTIEDQWQRAIAVITSALASFQRIKSMHEAAARQLDSADYALTQLLHDLRPAMALPADVSGLRAVLAEAEQAARVRRSKALAA